VKVNIQGNVGVSTRLSSQDGIPQQQKTDPLSLPQLNCLHETSFRTENSTSNDGVDVIPSHLKVTQLEESVFRTEMTDLESQEEDAPKRVLFYKPMSWLRQIRSHRRDESWSVSL
jgi:hypothetical protein